MGKSENMSQKVVTFLPRDDYSLEKEINRYVESGYELVQCVPFTANDRLPAYTLVFTEVKE